MVSVLNSESTFDDVYYFLAGLPLGVAIAVVRSLIAELLTVIVFVRAPLSVEMCELFLKALSIDAPSELWGRTQKTEDFAALLMLRSLGLSGFDLPTAPTEQIDRDNWFQLANYAADSASLAIDVCTDFNRNMFVGEHLALQQGATLSLLEGHITRAARVLRWLPFMGPTNEKEFLLSLLSELALHRTVIPELHFHLWLIRSSRGA